MSGKKPGFDEQFCPSCGDIANEQAPYCPSCGHPISPDKQGDKATTETGDVEIGYETIEEKRKQRAEKAKEVSETVVENSGSVVPMVKSAVLWIVGLFLFLGGLGSFSSPELSPVVGVPLLFIGLLLLPPVHGLIGRDDDPFSFGPRRTVEEHSVINPDQPCVACASPVEEGVKRDRVKQFVIFGGAISSNIEGESIYCQNCARGEITHIKDDSPISPDETQRKSNQADENTESEALSKNPDTGTENSGAN
ncbi:hypothetical protein [Halovenus salina]|uniref:DUF8108 domain-containing protein n=1 Tax=Halovenus salina TaxID=1510225 RepID=A0ABD5VX37_9EURY|nr:hypothetical protein [Halovenus salina]